MRRTRVETPNRPHRRTRANANSSLSPSPHLHRPISYPMAVMKGQDSPPVAAVAGGDAGAAAEEDSAAAADAAAAAAAEGLMSAASEQLTLVYQGEVYVFEPVSPEKVHAVLLLLGGCEVPSGLVSMAVPTVYDDDKSTTVAARRVASLMRFREKRKERCFDKKIRYTVRKEVALRYGLTRSPYYSQISCQYLLLLSY